MPDVDLSNYEVLNATEFDSQGNGQMRSTLTIKFDESKIIDITYGGSTGYCETQEEYIEAVKDSIGRNMSIGDSVDYSEIEQTIAKNKTPTSIFTKITTNRILEAELNMLFFN